MRQQKPLFETARVFADLLCWRRVEIDDRSLQLIRIGTWILPLSSANSGQTLKIEQISSCQGRCCAF